MKLDKMTAHVRPISADEAIELGLCMARAWFGRLFGLWLGRAVLVGGVVFGLAVAYEYLVNDDVSRYVFLALLIAMYVFKPLFEINILLFLSRRLFDENFDELDGTLNLGTLFALCGRYRFSLQRPIVMAVYLLEGQRGKALSSRVLALSRGRSNALVRHTVAFFVAEWFLGFAGLWFAIELRELNPLMTSATEFGGSNFWLGLLVIFWILLAQGLIAVFFVASGFSLYVCQRSLLEGWDIELGFRRLAGRFLANRQGGV